VQLALRFSLPMFVEPIDTAHPSLHYRLENAAGGTVLVVTNSGGRHETLRNIVLSGEGDAQAPINKGGSPYLLAGATRSLTVAGRSTELNLKKRYRLTAQSGAGPVDIVITAQPDAQ
jgi:fimbrial chaperone protein